MPEDQPEHKPELKVITNLGQTIRGQSGDVYEFTSTISTRAGHLHPCGSLLYVHDHTQEAPHDEIGENGNWWCRTDFGLSIWATLEQCIARGLLKKVGGPR